MTEPLKFWRLVDDISTSKVWIDEKTSDGFLVLVKKLLQDHPWIYRATFSLVQGSQQIQLFQSYGMNHRVPHTVLLLIPSEEWSSNRVEHFEIDYMLPVFRQLDEIIKKYSVASTYSIRLDLMPDRKVYYIYNNNEKRLAFDELCRPSQDKVNLRSLVR